MLNFFMCILWPLLIGGIIASSKFGNKHWGRKGSIFLPVAFLTVFFLALWLWVGEFWLEILLSPYLAQ